MTALTDAVVTGQPRRSMRRYHREVFFAANGFGPYQCFDCCESVTFDEVTVHHADHDHSNNDPSNLKAAHGECHMRHHSKTRAGEKRGPYKRVYVMTDEHRAAIARGKTGQRHSEETRKKISEKARGRKINRPKKAS